MFAKFKIHFGVQKVGAMWLGVDPDDVMDEWRAELGGFPPHVLVQAWEAIKNTGDEWPPALPKFKATCRDFHRPGPDVDQTVKLMAPGQGFTDAEAARRNLVKIRRMMATAFKPMRVPGEDDEA